MDLLDHDEKGASFHLDQRELLMLMALVHAKGFRADTVLPIGGFYKARKSGETHAWEATSMHMLQAACDRASYAMWQQYSAKMRAAPPIHLRDLLDIKPLGHKMGVVSEPEGGEAEPKKAAH